MKVIKVCLIVSLILNCMLIFSTMSPPAGVENPRFVKKLVSVTAYSPSPHITDGDPFKMASGKVAKPRDLWEMRYVAVSRDLMKEFGIKYGDIIYIGFEVQDTMAAKVTTTIDLFLRNLSLARRFGRQERYIIIERRQSNEGGIK